MSAAAPPMAAKYTTLFFTMASTTSLERGPLPIMPLSPCSIIAGEYASMRPDVVGPHDPMTRPGLAGVGPA